MSNLRLDGPRVYSYSTCLIDVLPDGRRIGNLTRYSTTTRRHQTAVRVGECDILVTGVPPHTASLVGWLQSLSPSQQREAVSPTLPEVKRRQAKRRQAILQVAVALQIMLPFS